VPGGISKRHSLSALKGYTLEGAAQLYIVLVVVVEVEVVELVLVVDDVVKVVEV